MDMDKHKLHLVACYVASLAVDENYIRCKEASDNGTTDELLSNALIKRGLIMASIPIIKDGDMIRAVKEDIYFLNSFKLQVKTLVSTTKFYN